MEVLFGILGTVVQLAFLGGIVWVIVRLVGRQRRDEDEAEPEVDRATSVRRLFVGAALLVTLILTATGVTMIGSTALTSDWGDGERTSFALGLAFALVAGPAYGLLLRYQRAKLRDDVGERTSFAWTAYLNIALASSLIVSVISVHQFLEGLVGAVDLEWRGLAPAIVWSTVWALHWFLLRPAFGLRGDLHLAAGTVTGLVTLLIGLGGLVHVAGDEIYTSLVDRIPEGHDSPHLATGLIAAVLGAAVWAWHWLGGYRRAERTSVWHVVVLLVATLGGLAAAIASAATITYWTAVWYLGTPRIDVAAEHFEDVSIAAGFFVAGALSWAYHRTVLHRGEPVERSEPLRAYDYLMSASGLVAAVVGGTIAFAALFESIADRITDDPTEVANQLILAVILGAIGAPLWWFYWSRIRGHAADDPLGEIGSPTRRIHLVALFGAGGLAALISLIAVLYSGINDLLDDAFGGDTLRSARFFLALLVTVTGVAWYHLGVFRSDRATTEVFTPPAAPLPPPATHVVLIAPRDGGLGDTLANATGAVVETWVRDDDSVMPEIDIDELIARILHDAGHDVAVVVGDDGVDVIPYRH